MQRRAGNEIIHSCARSMGGLFGSHYEGDLLGATCNTRWISQEGNGEKQWCSEWSRRDGMTLPIVVVVVVVVVDVQSTLRLRPLLTQFITLYHLPSTYPHSHQESPHRRQV